jgi:hypothetical protein
MNAPHANINYTRFETYTNRNGQKVSDLVVLPNQVVLDGTGSPHNTFPLMEQAKVNYSKKLERMRDESN